MEIVIDNYRIRRYDSLNLCVEVYKQVGKAKNPYGRKGKPNNSEIAQKNESNKPKYKWDLVGYYNTLPWALKQLIEHCLTNNDDINNATELRNRIIQLEGKIDEVLNSLFEKYGLPKHEDFKARNSEDESEAERLAEEYAKAIFSQEQA